VTPGEQIIAGATRGDFVGQYDMLKTGMAWFSPCKRYRYLLRYAFTGTIVQPPKNPIVFLMNNPSTADAFAPDPTVRRCIVFARDMGHSDLIVVNAHGWRSPEPDDLLKVDDPVGPWNDLFLAGLPPTAPIIAAWGSHKAPVRRAPEVIRVVGRQLLCLRVSEKSGMPEHPLYLPASLRPKPYEWRPR
jgi:hypothetical protein